MNTDAKPVPGPWEVQDLGAVREHYPDWHQYAIRHTETNVHLATVGGIDRYFEGQTEANARLMAAAPDMFAALDMILYSANTHLEELEDHRPITYHVDGAWIDKARAALARARGEAAHASR